MFHQTLQQPVCIVEPIPVANYVALFPNISCPATVLLAPCPISCYTDSELNRIPATQVCPSDPPPLPILKLTHRNTPLLNGEIPLSMLTLVSGIIVLMFLTLDSTLVPTLTQIPRITLETCKMQAFPARLIPTWMLWNFRKMVLDQKFPFHNAYA